MRSRRGSRRRKSATIRCSRCPICRSTRRTSGAIMRRSEEHTSELQSHSDLHSFPTRRSSDLDAIKKGFEAQEKRNDPLFQVPYLPIDPKDVGRDYEAVIRINSQSGKGGLSYILRADHGLDLPRPLQVEFSKIAQARMDRDGKELTSADIWDLFNRTY